MKMAILIQNNDQSEYNCNICSESISSNKIIGLGCNPTKHIFCYDCISEWYKELRINKKNNYGSNTITLNMCPICRKDGGLLPHISGVSYIPGIHSPYNTINIPEPITISTVCGAKFLTKTGFCTFKGQIQYGGFCCKHMNSQSKESSQEIPIISAIEQSTQNFHSTLGSLGSLITQTNVCGYKLTTKNGYCKLSGKQQYDNLCLAHFKCKNKSSVNHVVV